MNDIQQRDALILASQGDTPEQIATNLGISEADAKRAIKPKAEAKNS